MPGRLDCIYPVIDVTIADSSVISFTALGHVILRPLKMLHNQSVMHHSPITYGN